MSSEALLRACKEAGGQTSLAKRIGTTQSQVWYWLNRSKKGVPAAFAREIELATGISRLELLWPDESRV